MKASTNWLLSTFTKGTTLENNSGFCENPSLVMRPIFQFSRWTLIYPAQNLFDPKLSPLSKLCKFINFVCNIEIILSLPPQHKPANQRYLQKMVCKFVPRLKIVQNFVKQGTASTVRGLNTYLWWLSLGSNPATLCCVSASGSTWDIVCHKYCKNARTNNLSTINQQSFLRQRGLAFW